MGGNVFWRESKPPPPPHRPPAAGPRVQGRTFDVRVAVYTSAFSVLPPFPRPVIPITFCGDCAASLL